MPRHWLAAAVVLAGAGFAVSHFAGAQATTPTDPKTIAQGKYLVAAGDCAACHTEPQGQPFAGGVIIRTSFGKMLGSNITPDRQTGIGNWTADEFVRAIKYGVGHSGHLYPGMPYIYFNNIPRADIVKMQAYLATVTPVHRFVQSNQLIFPVSIRASMIAWNLLFFPNHGDYQNDSRQTAEWNRGAYLVQGLGHCAACHTSKNILGGDHTSEEFEGAVVDGLNAPALVDNPHNGLGDWTAGDIGAYLKTGHNRFADAAGPMATVITYSTSQLTTADDQAMGVYVHSLQSHNEAAQAPVDPAGPVMVAGAHIYADQCSACHMSSGEGEQRIIPSLKGSPVVVTKDPVSIIRVVLNGGDSVDVPGGTSAAMPAFGKLLQPQDIADVLTYIRNNWGNAAAPVTADKVNSEASSP